MVLTGVVVAAVVDGARTGVATIELEEEVDDEEEEAAPEDCTFKYPAELEIEFPLL